MNGCGNTCDNSFLYTTDMIGINLQSNAPLYRPVDDQISGNGPKRFCQGNGSTAMEYACWLPRSVIHGHGSGQKIIADFSNNDPEVLHHGAFFKQPYFFK